MSFSIGEDVNKNLLKIGDKMSKNTENSFNDTYALQARLSNWFKNNPGEILTRSQSYSGMKENNENVPLGGPIDYNQQNIMNAQGTDFLSDEFPFWENEEKPIQQQLDDATLSPEKEDIDDNIKKNQDNLIVNEAKRDFNKYKNYEKETYENLEKTLNEHFEKKEKFANEDSGSGGRMILLIVLIAVPILLILGYLIYLIVRKDKKLDATFGSKQSIVKFGFDTVY